MQPEIRESRRDHRLHGRLVPLVFLLSLTAILVYAVIFLTTPIAQADREGRELRNVYLLVLGVLGLAQAVYFARSRSGGVTNWLAMLLPCYAAFQLVPMPLPILRILSPARAELVDALTPLGLQAKYAPSSVAPSLTLNHLLLFTGYVVVFILVQKIARAIPDMTWLVAIPIIGIAAWQGAWGLLQFTQGGTNAYAHGTYPVRNHFAGFLEMSLPFALAYAGSSLGKKESRTPLPASAGLRAGAGFAAAALIAAGILCSLSRMGFVASGVSVCVMGTLLVFRTVRGKKRWLTASAVGLMIVAAFVFLAPSQLVVRFAEISSDGRSDVWRDTLHLIAAYPLLGTGLGGYESAFEKFKTTGFTLIQDYAHNDYLQFLAELGVVGFLIGGAFLLRTLMKSVRGSLRPANPSVRWVGLACSGSLAAILIHSLADFNLYVPANATLLAWICGIAAGSLPESYERDVVNPRSSGNLVVETQG